MKLAMQQQRGGSGDFSSTAQEHALALKDFMPSNELFGVGFLVLLCVMVLQYQRPYSDLLNVHHLTPSLSTSNAQTSKPTKNGLVEGAITATPITAGAITESSIAENSLTTNNLTKDKAHTTAPLSASAIQHHIQQSSLGSLVAIVKAKAPGSSNTQEDEAVNKNASSESNNLVLRLRAEAFFSEGDSRLSRAGNQALALLATFAHRDIHIELSARPNAKAEYLYNMRPSELASARIAALKEVSSKQGQFGSITISDVAF